MVLPPSIETPVNLAEQLLDRGYDQAAGSVIRAISANSTSGIMAERLRQFEVEAARLAEAGEPLTASNPIVRALLADFEDTLTQNAALINGAAPDVQSTGINAAADTVRQMALPGLDSIQVLSVGWNTPNVEQVAALVGYVDSPAFAVEIGGYQSNVFDAVRNAIIRGQIQGHSPIAIARDLRGLVEGLPTSYANQIMRSLQLTSWRDASVIHEVANAAILEPEVIRIATLDDRTCMACLVLHGTRIRLGDRVDGHRNCRCTSIPVVRGRPRDIQTGEDWFSGLDTERQQQQMGGAAYRAWQAGAINLRDLVQHGQDDLFGAAINEASLKGLLGEGARLFYSR